jgi:hypothetical protein
MLQTYQKGLTMTTDTMTASSPLPITRVLDEGYGPGAWHGADMKAAIADVTPALAFWRSGKGRHNIAEIALHHAWTVRNVTEKVTGGEPPALPVEGADWLVLDNEKLVSWAEIQRAVETQQQALASAASMSSVASEKERFDLALGVTCHAVYHAGQIQLIKVLRT